jgi:8-oxo-dGTP pyrophosphatase MutT (NUDIX family)
MHVRYDMISCFVIRPTTTGGWEFLQLQRTHADFLGGTWQTIYGTSNPGESPAAAAVRELSEETGLVPLELYQLNDVDVFYIATHDTMWHCICFCAIVNPTATTQLNAEHDAFRWLPAEAAREHFMWPGNRRAVDEIKSQIIGNGLTKSLMRMS